MSLITGRRISKKKWTELLMPNWVVDKVNFIGHKKDHIWMSGGSPVATMRIQEDGVPESEGTLNEDDTEDD